MARFLSKALGFVLALSVASAAAAVPLDSSGSNDEYIGVANFAFSYASSPLELTAKCYLYGAKDSSWEAPSTCSSNGEACWATTCDNCENASAYISVGSMRKALLHYYARDHKDSDQGVCDFTVGTSSFSLSFDYQDTGVDFSLSLIAGAGPAWVSGDGEACPFKVGATAGPLIQVFSANTDVKNPYNLICNEEVIVSLAADPNISNGAMVSVTNNSYGLLSGVQEAPASSSTALGETLVGKKPTANRRRLADRPTDEGRWLVTGDGAGDSFQGVLLSESETGPEVEFVSCEGIGGYGGEGLALTDYGYACDFVSKDGTRTRAQSLSLPSTQLRPFPLAGPAPGPRNGPSDTGLAAGVLKRIHEFARLARVASPGDDGEGSSPFVWQGDGANQSIVMVQDRSAKRLEIVNHTVGGLSPTFVTCTERTEDERNLGYVCQNATRCVGEPCPAKAWSGGRAMEFPKALFKDRPCRPGEGAEVQQARLKLKRLGMDEALPTLRFRSTVTFEEGAEVSPQSNGFRLLVEDADGKTVVDVDVPPAGTADTSGGRKGRSKGWTVRKGGDDLRYRAGKLIGGVLPRATIRKRGKGSNSWEIEVKVRRGQFGDDDLALPLAASLSLDTTDPNSSVCAVVPFLEKRKGRRDDDSDEKSAKSACKRDDQGHSIKCRQRRD